MEGKFELQFEDNEYYLVDGNTNDTIATTDKVLLKKDGYMGKLSIKNCEAIVTGYDLDELAEKHYDVHIKQGHTEEDSLQRKIDFTIGFVSALEILGDKKFTIEDIQNVIDSNEDSLVYQTVSENGDIKFYLDEDALTESLQQTEWDVEIVMDICGDKVYAVPEIVLDADGCLILKRI